MIKITHIIGRLVYGGAEKLLLDLCRKVDKTRFEVEVLVLQEPNSLLEQFENAGIKVKCFHKKSKIDFGAVKKLTEHLKRTKPDIVHTHLFVADFWGGRAAESAGVKHCLSTKHDILSEGFWRNHYGRKARRKFDKIIAISNATREYLIKEEKIPVEKIEVIYNGIDVNKFYVESPGIFKKQDLRVGSIGRLTKEKGHKHLIRACRFLRNKDWSLTLVGDGPLKKDLETLVKYLSISDKVKFAGEVEDVRPYLNEMDIFVLPSVSEGLSLVILEAALAARFVIATKVGGVPEIIEDKENGLLFQPKNIEQLLAHLNWVDENREQAARMALKLQKQVAEKFDINKTVKQYEQLYENIIGK